MIFGNAFQSWNRTKNNWFKPPLILRFNINLGQPRAQSHFVMVDRVEILCIFEEHVKNVFTN